MMDPMRTFAAPAPDPNAALTSLGWDASDLTWKQLEATRAQNADDVPPNARPTTPEVSPRKIMMSTRDRIEEIGKREANGGGTWKNPVGRLDHRRGTLGLHQLPKEGVPHQHQSDGQSDMSPIMEDSKSPESITSMFNNIENNGAPWAFPAASRGDWTQES